VVFAAALAGVLGWQRTHGGHRGRHVAALDAARTRTAELLSYSTPTLDADLAAPSNR